jgi:hypothetical protein
LAENKPIWFFINPVRFAGTDPQLSSCGFFFGNFMKNEPIHAPPKRGVASGWVLYAKYRPACRQAGSADIINDAFPPKADPPLADIHGLTAMVFGQP